jgi:cyclopropane-fatty-acyl-phospholipid synthase
MNLVAAATYAVERVPLPDGVLNAGISALVGRTARKLAQLPGAAELEFAQQMQLQPVAEFTEAANAQHYELPAQFFALALGPRRKYSCCHYSRAGMSLAEAEEEALEITAARAELADGQDILELGCGWGSLSLWMAERYRKARITAVSNSAGQRRHIEAEAMRRRLTNLRVITADMNHFNTDQRFDRMVSVEMFEHLSNWPAMFDRLAGWLRPDARAFVHVFSHRSQPYRFDHADKADWIAQHFFTGGIMPSHALIEHAGGPFSVEASWRWSGQHYQQTALHWLENFDANQEVVAQILLRVYGPQWRVWRQRWRLFFLATAGLFGARNGEEWGVSHYRLSRG